MLSNNVRGFGQPVRPMEAQAPSIAGQTPGSTDATYASGIGVPQAPRTGMDPFAGSQPKATSSQQILSGAPVAQNTYWTNQNPGGTGAASTNGPAVQNPGAALWTDPTANSATPGAITQQVAGFPSDFTVQAPTVQALVNPQLQAQGGYYASPQFLAQQAAMMAQSYNADPSLYANRPETFMSNTGMTAQQYNTLFPNANVDVNSFAGPDTAANANWSQFLPGGQYADIMRQGLAVPGAVNPQAAAALQGLAKGGLQAGGGNASSPVPAQATSALQGSTNTALSGGQPNAAAANTPQYALTNPAPQYANNPLGYSYSGGSSGLMGNNAFSKVTTPLGYTSYTQNGQANGYNPQNQQSPGYSAINALMQWILSGGQASPSNNNVSQAVNGGSIYGGNNVTQNVAQMMANLDWPSLLASRQNLGWTPGPGLT